MLKLVFEFGFNCVIIMVLWFKWVQNIWVDTGVKEYCIFYFFLNKENYKVFHDIHYKEMLNVN